MSLPVPVLDELVEDAACGDDDVEDPEPPTTVGEPVWYMMPLLVAAPLCPLLVVACRLYTAVGAGTMPRSRLAPALLLKVTSAFSEPQLSPALAKRPKRVSPFSATLKLAVALARSRGIALPIVASLVEPTLVVVQAASEAVPHVEPV